MEHQIIKICLRASCHRRLIVSNIKMFLIQFDGRSLQTTCFQVTRFYKIDTSSAAPSFILNANISLAVMRLMDGQCEQHFKPLRRSRSLNMINVSLPSRSHLSSSTGRSGERFIRVEPKPTAAARIGLITRGCVCFREILYSPHFQDVSPLRSRCCSATDLSVRA